jgi:hypothetical protein
MTSPVFAISVTAIRAKTVSEPFPRRFPPRQTLVRARTTPKSPGEQVSGRRLIRSRRLTTTDCSTSRRSSPTPKKRTIRYQRPPIRNLRASAPPLLFDSLSHRPSSLASPQQFSCTRRRGPNESRTDFSARRVEGTTFRLPKSPKARQTPITPLNPALLTRCQPLDPTCRLDFAQDEEATERPDESILWFVLDSNVKEVVSEAITVHVAQYLGGNDAPLV